MSPRGRAVLWSHPTACPAAAWCIPAHATDYISVLARHCRAGTKTPGEGRRIQVCATASQLFLPSQRSDYTITHRHSQFNICPRVSHAGLWDNHTFHLKSE